MSNPNASSWNDRVMQYGEGHPKFTPYTHGIHEVYFAQDGSVKTWSEDAVTLLGFDRDNLEWRLHAIQDALNKPVLQYEPSFKK